MRKFCIFSLFLLLAVYAYGQQIQPELYVRSDANGKYGYFDGNGNCVIPCIFDYAFSFPAGRAISTVEYDGRYYLIDRNGYLVTEEGFESLPQEYDRYAVVSRETWGEPQFALIDFSGNRISPEGISVAPLRYAPESEDPVLFSMGKENSLVLTDFSFRPLSKFPVQDLYHDVYCPEAIVFRIGDNFYGLMNADGKVLIEARYVPFGLNIFRISEVSSYVKWLEKEGMLTLYTEEELRNICLVLISGGGKSVIYDITGELVVPEQKSASAFLLMRRNLRNHIVPYLRRKAENKARLEERVLEPYERRRNAAVNLPEGTSHKYPVFALIERRGEPESSLPASAPRPSDSFTSGGTQYAGLTFQDGSTLQEDRNLYYLNKSGEAVILAFARTQLGTFVTLCPFTVPGYFYPRFVLSGETDDSYEFSKYTTLMHRNNPGYVAGFDFETELIVGEPFLTISKDWKSVVTGDGRVFDIPITESEYNDLVDSKYIEDVKSGAYRHRHSSGNTSGFSIDYDSDTKFPTNRHGYYTCPNCHGTGRCPHCSHGIAGNSYLGGKPMLCSVCNGTGRCMSCNGTGKKYGVIH